jgi:hypothetical protein
MIYRWRHPTRASHLLGIAQGFAELADGLITLCTLGFFASCFEMRVASYRSKQYFSTAKKGKK